VSGSGWDNSLGVPVLVSEREPTTPWNDCTWASGTMFGNAETLGIYPPKRATYEALRAASGDLGFSNMADLVKGMTKLWGWTGKVVGTWAALESALASKGAATIVQGMYGALPTHYRRWQPNFLGPHAVYVQRLSTSLWIEDPLALWGYSGEVISLADVKSFFTGLGGAQAMLGRVGGRDMLVIEEVHLNPKGAVIFRIAPGATVRGWDPARPGKPIKTNTWANGSGAHYDAMVNVSWPGTSPAPVPHGTFLRCIDGFYAGLLIAPSEVIEGDTGKWYTQADMDAQLARIEGIKAKNAEIKALSTDIEDD